jgi:peptidoglycan/xylan/chitin deacetylase (PgdA/CDA1 family)
MGVSIADYLTHYGGWLVLAGIVVVLLAGALFVFRRAIQHETDGGPYAWVGVAALVVGAVLITGMVTWARYTRQQGEVAALVGRRALNLVNPRPVEVYVGGLDHVILDPLGWDFKLRNTAKSPEDDQNLEELRSNRVAVQAGQQYTYSLHAWPLHGLFRPALAQSPVQMQVRLLWEDAALHDLSWADSPTYIITDTGIVAAPTSDPSLVIGRGVAPPQAAYLQLVIRQLSGNGQYVDVTLTADGVRVEPYPDAARAALAFSFDWESAMGGSIHSKGAEGHDPAAATAHGLAMRQGADILREIFATHAVSATFYATGYNLLDGNTERRTFSGNPTYSWAKPKWGWATDYWTTHPWYGDDPFGTVQSDPAWYCGDQTDALRAAGHEIGSHTFGHLYVRGATPEELDTDLGEWDRAAAARALPPVQSFAFPWQSSNSLISGSGRSSFYDVMAAHGITSVTRIYPSDLRDHYTLSAVPLYISPTLQISPDISIMPEFLLGPPLEGAGDVAITGTVASGVDEARGEVGTVAGAKQVIDTVLARRGVTSFWNHPEQLATNPDVANTWRETVAYAAERRKAGLWIAPVSTIAGYMRDVRQVEVVWQAQAGGYGAIVTNHTAHALDGVTLSFPIAVQAATVEGQPAPRVQETLVVLPRLAAGATVDVQATGVSP